MGISLESVLVEGFAEVVSGPGLVEHELTGILESGTGDFKIVIGGQEGGVDGRVIPWACRVENDASA